MALIPNEAKLSISSNREACPLRSSWLKYLSCTRLIVHSKPPHIASSSEKILFFNSFIRHLINLQIVFQDCRNPCLIKGGGPGRFMGTTIPTAAGGTTRRLQVLFFKLN